MLLPRLILVCLFAWVLTTRGESACAAKDTTPRLSEQASSCTLPDSMEARVKLQPSDLPPKLTVQSRDAGTRVLVDDELFAEYLRDTGHQPAVWPIIGPTGHEMTRSWPIGPRQRSEKTDHPHHKSLWFAHGGVNGGDFWHEKETRIRQSGPVRSAVSSDGAVVLTTWNEWEANETRVLSDERMLAFGLLGGGVEPARYIDFTIRLIATDGEAIFADTKEGSFGVRVSGPMKLEAQPGGSILNSNGQRDADAWGRVAPWVAYQGPLAIASQEVSAATGGVVIMSHPAADLPECRWHVRGYGLFAANPFSVTDFPDPPSDAREVTLAAGESLTLRYRTVFYGGEAPADGIRSWYDQFAATPLRAEP